MRMRRSQASIVVAPASEGIVPMRRGRQTGERRDGGREGGTDPATAPASTHNTDINQIGFEREKSAIDVGRSTSLDVSL